MNPQPFCSLLHLGFDPFFAEQVTDIELTPGRVLRAWDRQCDVLSSDGVRHALLPRRLCRPRPVVGDWVLLQPQPVGDPLVAQRLTRKTELGRAAAGTRTRKQVIAANLDLVFVVMGLDGDFNLRRLERYLAMCADAQIPVVVLLTKAGPHPEFAPKVAACQAIAPPQTVHMVAAVDVLAGVNAALPLRAATGKSVALVGSSGAGKSTLANHILGRQQMATGAVRRGDDRGRHTTTHRELLPIPGGGVLIDNPGIRELGLWIEGDGLTQAFGEVEQLAQACRFRDCTHRHEPGCAVLAARDGGELDAGRLANYDRLQREVAATERRRNEHVRRADERKLGKLYRRVQRERRRRRGE